MRELMTNFRSMIHSEYDAKLNDTTIKYVQKLWDFSIIKSIRIC